MAIKTFTTITQTLCFLSIASTGFGSPLASLMNMGTMRRSDLQKREGGPIQQIFSMMGDSFGSGIGAGKQWEQQETLDICKRGDWSVGGLLYADPKWWAGDQNQIQFIACSGAKAEGMQKDKPQWKGRDPQNKEFAVAENDAAVIWAGGNDAGFFKILDGCVYHFYGPFSYLCSDAIREVLLTIQKPEFADIFRKDYYEIMDAAHPKAESFTLYVLTYPNFFNAASDSCDNSAFCFWNAWCGPTMSKDTRVDLNDLMGEINNIIAKAANEIGVQFQGTNKFISVIDTNPAFEGHRFCEDGSVEPNPNNPNNYFFQLYDQDVSPDGNQYDNLPSWPNKTAAITVGEASLPDAGECETNINNNVDMDFGENAACRISIVLAKNDNTTLADSRYPEAQGSDYSQVAYGRIFHPKSKGHAVVKDLIMAAAAKSPTPTSAPPPTSISTSPPTSSSTQFDNFNCSCNENGCTPESAPCCGNGSCACHCGENGCSTEDPVCCGNGSCIFG